MTWLRRIAVAALPALFALNLAACAGSVRPLDPPTMLVDVLKMGAEVPLEDYIDQARQGITESGEWTIDREEDERTGGRVSHTTVWVVRSTEDSRVDVRLDFRDGMYGIVITGSTGLSNEDQDCVVRLDQAIHAAIGL